MSISVFNPDSVDFVQVWSRRDYQIIQKFAAEFFHSPIKKRQKDMGKKTKGEVRTCQCGYSQRDRRSARPKLYYKAYNSSIATGCEFSSNIIRLELELNEVGCVKIDGVQIKGFYGAPPSIRVANGPTMYEGRLEILHDQEWGSICDEEFTETEAVVACRELGFDFESIVDSSDEYGWTDDLPIHVIGINCTGRDKLRECVNFETTTKGKMCYHVEDVGLQCSTRVIDSAVQPCRLVTGLFPPDDCDCNKYDIPDITCLDLLCDDYTETYGFYWNISTAHIQLSSDQLGRSTVTYEPIGHTETDTNVMNTLTVPDEGEMTSLDEKEMTSQDKQTIATPEGLDITSPDGLYMTSLTGQDMTTEDKQRKTSPVKITKSAQLMNTVLQHHQFDATSTYAYSTVVTIPHNTAGQSDPLPHEDPKNPKPEKPMDDLLMVTSQPITEMPAKQETSHLKGDMPPMRERFEDTFATLQEKDFMTKKTKAEIKEISNSLSMISGSASKSKETAKVFLELCDGLMNSTKLSIGSINGETDSNNYYTSEILGVMDSFSMDLATSFGVNQNVSQFTHQTENFYLHIDSYVVNQTQGETFSFNNLSDEVDVTLNSSSFYGTEVKVVTVRYENIQELLSTGENNSEVNIGSKVIGLTIITNSSNNTESFFSEDAPVEFSINTVQ
ncbi:putative soluble scavenger receptor cysteine-rich domain-containing protein SSC5D, partial [Apostichopus japonicus]